MPRNVYRASRARRPSTLWRNPSWISIHGKGPLFRFPRWGVRLAAQQAGSERVSVQEDNAGIQSAARMSSTHCRPSVALLLSAVDFEGFYGGVLRLDRERYLREYRNDFSFSYAHSLAGKGISTFIYIPTRESPGVHRISERIAVRFLPLARWFTLWLRIGLLSRTPAGRYVKEVANTAAFLGPLQAAIRQDGVQVLLVQEYWTGRFDYLSSRSPVPVIAVDQGGQPRRQIKFFKRAAFSRVHALTCQTEEETTRVREYGGNAVLMPNGIDSGFFDVDSSVHRSRHVLTVARLTDWQKRTSDLIRALSAMSCSWELKIAGVGPDEFALRDLAARLGVGDRVHFLGFVKDKSVLRRLYQECGVFSLPSAHEGLPLAVLEAMSCGTACVVTDIPAFRMVMSEQGSGLRIPVGDARALAVAIERAWECRDAIGKHARRAVLSNYSQSGMADRLSALIVSVA
jgi:glycosyltransferase involved in cell wall biosynthesis